ncbi:carboxylesterase 4A-like [Artemia franciscana]|uniref:carboxylesterase 4A-like n=1 Tax=Artemia franciscana TaxID=6661 RepID=UPI0032DB3A28
MTGPIMKLLLLFSFIISVWSIDVPLSVPGFGNILGKTGKSYLKDETFYSFRGIRYAKAPTSETRFLPPVPADPLPDGEVFDARKSGPQCNQLGVGEEDCLLLNVYSRMLPNETHPSPNLPVMVFIHGGAFFIGQTYIYTPYAFMDTEVVLVTIQYRLGPLGFLSLDVADMPGNAGIYDMIESLRWVQKHIASFGGNPDDVTIFGESAGGASVGLLLLCQQARGLFRNAIAQSGSALLDWAYDPDPVTDTLIIAERVNCTSELPDEIIRCLRNVDADALTLAYLQYAREELNAGRTPFGGTSPVVQKAGSDPLITESPRTLMERGEFLTDVNVIFGANKHEGTFITGVIYEGYLAPNNLVNDTEYLKRECFYEILNALTGTFPTDQEVDDVITTYFNGLEMGNFTSMVPGFVDMGSTIFFKQGALDSARYYSRYNPNTYMYAFNYYGRLSIFSFLYGNHPFIPRGVSHGDDLVYLFQFTSIFNETEEHMTERMIQLWTNFGIYGNPTPDGVPVFPDIPKWLPFNEQTQHYLEIDNEFVMRLNYEDTFTVAVDEGFGTLTESDQFYEENLIPVKSYLRN